MQFRGKIGPACSYRLVEGKWEMFYHNLCLKELYLKSEFDISSFEQAQKGHFFELWTQIAVIFD